MSGFSENGRGNSVRFSTRADNAGSAMDIAKLNSQITVAVEQIRAANPALADHILEAKRTAEETASQNGDGALDAMNVGHRFVIDNFPEMRKLLRMETDADKAQTQKK